MRMDLKIGHHSRSSLPVSPYRPMISSYPVFSIPNFAFRSPISMLRSFLVHFAMIDCHLSEVWKKSVQNWHLSTFHDSLVGVRNILYLDTVFRRYQTLLIIDFSKYHPVTFFCYFSTVRRTSLTEKILFSCIFLDWIVPLISYYFRLLISIHFLFSYYTHLSSSIPSQFHFLIYVKYIYFGSHSHLSIWIKKYT